MEFINYYISYFLIMIYCVNGGVIGIILVGWVVFCGVSVFWFLIVYFLGVG